MAQFVLCITNTYCIKSLSNFTMREHIVVTDETKRGGQMWNNLSICQSKEQRDSQLGGFLWGS